MSEKIAKCCADINKYNQANEELVAALLKTYQLVLSKADTRRISKL
jgi:hypothetical protein